MKEKELPELPFLTIEEAAKLLGHNATPNVRTWLSKGILKLYDAKVKIKGTPPFMLSTVNSRLICRKSVRRRQLESAVFVEFGATAEMEFKDIAAAARFFNVGRQKIDKSIKGKSGVDIGGVEHHFYRKTIEEENKSK